MENEGYQGWSNYETWLVALWLDNERASYEYWRDHAASHRQHAPECKTVESGIWTIQEAAKYNLAEQLKEEVADASPLSESSLYSDLLAAALDEVDWYELADHLLAELPPVGESTR